MPKDIASGSVPMSKNQRNKARNARKLVPRSHVGKLVCSACGQESTSATLGSNHATCDGRSTRHTGALAVLAQRVPVLADGTASKRWSPGKWEPAAEVAARREIRATQAEKFLKSEKHCFVEPGGVRFENGLGEPITIAGVVTA